MEVDNGWNWTMGGSGRWAKVDDGWKWTRTIDERGRSVVDVEVKIDFTPSTPRASI